MKEFSQATPQVKKNILLIRLLLAVILLCLAFLEVQSHPGQKTVGVVYALALGASFLPFFGLHEDKFKRVNVQYSIFAMDFLFLLLGLYLFDHFETNLLIITFLTFFISALSQSVGRSLVVGLAVTGLYVYLVYLKSDNFNTLDPLLLLSCALLFVVAIHSGYLAYRAVQEEKEITDLARKAALLSERVKAGDQAALDYAATLKNVLDTLPLGAIAVSTEANVIFVNAQAGRILEENPKSLTNLYLFMKDSPLGELGERMGRSLKDRRELKKEYLEITWKKAEKRFRLDSASGISPSGKVWGTLFLLQETARGEDPPKA